MKRSSSLVKQELTTFLSCGHSLQQSDWATSLLKTKLDGYPIRAYFLAKMADQLWPEAGLLARLARPQREWNRLLYQQLPFVFEVVITIQYLHNQILDGKSAVTERKQVSKNLLAANLLKEQLYHYLEEEFPSWAQKQTRQTVRKCFEWVDHGQQLEKSANNFQAFQAGLEMADTSLPKTVRSDVNLTFAQAFLDKLGRDLPTILHDQLQIYFSRIYLTCAALFVESSRLLGHLLQVPSRKLEPILGFSLCYGLMRQLVNDNADWIPSSCGLTTNTKIAADTFSDLRNGTLTLPLLFFLAENKNSLLQQTLNNETSWSSEYEALIFEEIISSNALYKSIQNTRILAELALAYLPEEKVSSTYLAQSCEIVHWNKFLAPLLRHTAYQKYRTTSYHRHTRRLIKKLRKERKNPTPVPRRIFSFPKTRQTVISSPVQQLECLLRQETAMR